MNIKILAHNILNNPKDFTVEDIEQLFNEYTKEPKTCTSCKYWSSMHGAIGACSMLENNLSYWESVFVAEEKIQDGKIGADNLYTHKNFGCIHYDKEI